MRAARAVPVLVLALIIAWFGIHSCDAARDDVVRPSDATSAQSRAAAPSALHSPRVRADDPPSSEQPGPDSAEDAASWVLVVLNADGAPVQGIPVSLDAEVSTPDPLRFADAAGRVVLPPGVQRGTRVRVWDAASDAWNPKHPIAGTDHELTGPRTELRVPGFLPLDVRLIDALTCKPLSGGAVSIGRVAMKPDGDHFVLSASLLRRGTRFHLNFGVTPPPGYAAPEAWVAYLSGTVDRDATRLLASVPLFPEARLRVRVTDAGGVSVSGATIDAIKVGEAESTRFTADPTDARGDAIVRGVPFIPGESVTAVVSHGEERWGASVAVRPTSRDREEVLMVTLDQEVGRPPPAARMWHTGIGVHGVETDAPEPLSIVRGAIVRVLTDEDVPIACALVTLATSDPKLPPHLLEGATQQFALLTDLRGEIAFPDVRAFPPVTITARYGSRRGTAALLSSTAPIVIRLGR